MPSLNQSADKSRICVYAGRRGSGKSYLMSRHIEDAIKSGQYANVVIFDPVVCMPDFQELCTEYSVRLRYLEYDFLKHQVTPAIPYGKPKSRNEIDWRHTLYAFDEIDLLCDAHKIDPTLDMLLNYSRHWACSIYCNFRRFARVHKTLESLATDFYIFQMIAPRDTQAVEAILSGIPDVTGREVSVARVKSLPLYHNIHVQV